MTAAAAAAAAACGLCCMVVMLWPCVQLAAASVTTAGSWRLTVPTLVTMQVTCARPESLSCQDGSHQVQAVVIQISPASTHSRLACAFCCRGHIHVVTMPGFLLTEQPARAAVRTTLFPGNMPSVTAAVSPAAVPLLPIAVNTQDF